MNDVDYMTGPGNYRLEELVLELKAAPIGRGVAAGNYRCGTEPAVTAGHSIAFFSMTDYSDYY